VRKRFRISRILGNASTREGISRITHSRIERIEIR
jgi:hypothetical protein